MSFKTKPPAEGDLGIFKGFALLPTRCEDGRRRWLCRLWHIEVFLTGYSMWAPDDWTRLASFDSLEAAKAWRDGMRADPDSLARTIRRLCRKSGDSN